MRSIRIGNYDTYDDFNLILIGKKIGTPKVKRKTISIEGADSELDYTEFFGEPKYDNRTLDFKFQLLSAPADFIDVHSRVANALNGQKVNIVLPDEPDFYYVGRVEVSDLETEKNQAFFEISCDCEPYKYKENVTVVSQAVSGSATIVLDNLRKRAVPTITTDAEFTFTWGKFSATVAAGTFLLPELELVAGSNTVTVTGTGNVAFEYQEGSM